MKVKTIVMNKQKKDKDYYYLNHKLFNVSPDVQGDNGNNNTT